MSRTPICFEVNPMHCNQCNTPSTCPQVCPTIDLKSFLLGATVVIGVELFSWAYVALSTGRLFH